MNAPSPTHYCVACAARWVNNPDGSWSLASNDCGPCCDNVPMGSAPIVKFLSDGTIASDDYERARRAYAGAQRSAEVDRYRGILCARCDEAFERHYSDWSCPRQVAPRFKFPAIAGEARSGEIVEQGSTGTASTRAVRHRPTGKAGDAQGPPA
jgi:hypothetical protein